MSRPLVSVTPPGAKGTMRRMGFSGKSARAANAMKRAVARAKTCFMVPPKVAIPAENAL
jgi:hypothetical protein